MNTAAEPMITLRDVHKSFGDARAVQGVSFTVPAGAVWGLLGPNGAGKTTLVRMLTTLLKPDAGVLTVAGIDVAIHPAAVRARIGLAGQYAAVDENLTGRENLELVGSLYHLPRAEARIRAERLLERFSLVDAARRVVKTYSGGMRRRLDLAASLVGEPEVLFLDEPTTGLDPRSRMELWEILEELVHEGATVLLTTQYLDEADYLADTIAVIDQGKLVAQGSASELKAHIGGGVVEIHLADKRKAHDALPLLKEISDTAPHLDEVTGHIMVPARYGTNTLLEAIRVLDRAGLELADIELRKPTLDEVFLALTGKPA